MAQTWHTVPKGFPNNPGISLEEPWRRSRNAVLASGECRSGRRAIRPRPGPSTCDPRPMPGPPAGRRGNGPGTVVSRREAENTTLSEVRDRYEREVSSQKRSSDQDRIYVRYWKKMALAARNLASNVEHVIICFELYAQDFLRPSSLYLYRS